MTLVISADGSARRLNPDGTTTPINIEAMDLDDAIDGAMANADEYEKAGDEECEFENRQLVRWLTQLRDLRFRARQLAKDLETVRGQLREMKRDVETSLDEDIHVTVSISRMGKGFRHANHISAILFDQPIPTLESGHTSGLERRALILRDVIEKVAYEAAIGFFGETER
jgi:hypothetical protein